ncbi:MAG TPA: MlaD family protein [Acetobacteraceae bacterium]|jgi:ABC-type transporter Mla subunit MlaD|nr:MlaD family protein [Acetobacteraceae bacterium]
MTQRALYLRVGLLLVIGAAAIVGFVLFLTGSAVRAGAHYETYFRESVQGLETGAPVKFRGVMLGQVTQISLATATYLSGQPPDVLRQANRYVVVRFVIDPTRVGRVPNTQTATRAGLRARLASQGLTGLAYLELDFADPHEYPPQEVPWTPKYEYIPSMPSTLLRVQDQAEALLTKLSDVDVAGLTGSLQRVLDDLHGQLSTGDAHQLIASATALLDTLHDAVQRSDLPGLSAELKATAAAARGMVQSKQTRDLLAEATKAATRFSDAAARLPQLIAALQTTVRRANETTGDVSAELAPVLRDAQAAVANLRDTTETLRRYPASVLFGGPPPRAAPTR